MAEAEGLPPTASTVVPGLSLNYVGDWAYSYSGIVTVNNVETTLLESTTGNSIFVGTFQPQYMAAGAGSGTEDFRFIVYLNGNIIASILIAEATDRDAFYRPVNLVIPSDTEIKITGANTTDTQARNIGAIMTGRVYDA